MASPLSYSNELAERLLRYKKLIRDHRFDFEEFREISTWAEIRGRRVWILGDSASAYGRAIKRRLQVPPLEQALLKKTLDFWDVFDPFHKIEIVVNANIEICRELQRFLNKKFLYYAVNESIWSVRPLNFNPHDPDADEDERTDLFSNDFQWQHRDLYSFALLELTSPPKESDIVQHAKRFQIHEASLSPDEIYLSWLTDKNPYLFNSRHDETTLAQNYFNPSYRSVLLYLIKMDQEGLEIDAQSMENLKRNIKSSSLKKVFSYQNEKGALIPKDVAYKRLEEVSLYFYRLTLGARNFKKVKKWLKELKIYKTILKSDVHELIELPEGDTDMDYFMNFGALLENIRRREHPFNMHFHSRNQVPLNAVDGLQDGDIIEGGSRFLSNERSPFIVDNSKPEFQFLKKATTVIFQKYTNLRGKKRYFKNTHSAISFVKELASLSINDANENRMPGYRVLGPYFKREFNTLDPSIILSVLLTRFNIPSKILFFNTGEKQGWEVFFRVPSSYFQKNQEGKDDFIGGSIIFNDEKDEELKLKAHNFSSNLLGTLAGLNEYMNSAIFKEQPSLWYDKTMYPQRTLCEKAFE